MEDLANHFNKYIPRSKISAVADPNSDVNFYFNWHGFKKKTRFDVCYFTHIENGSKHRQMWNNSIKNCDVAVMMGSRYALTAPDFKRVIFNPPPFEIYKNSHPIKLLVVGRSYRTGRKNYSTLEEVKKHCNVDITFSKGKMTQAELFQAYQNTDYILVTSKIEAGPMSVAEAIAMRKPVIAPDVGWCWEYPVVRYRSTSELIKILNKLSFQDNAWELSVGDCLNEIEKIYTGEVS
jgi:hypothetical protein